MYCTIKIAEEKRRMAQEKRKKKKKGKKGKVFFFSGHRRSIEGSKLNVEECRRERMEKDEGG